MHGEVAQYGFALVDLPLPVTFSEYGFLSGLVERLTKFERAFTPSVCNSRISRARFSLSPIVRSLLRLFARLPNCEFGPIDR
jgi:hypothetical protein